MAFRPCCRRGQYGAIGPAQSLTTSAQKKGSVRLPTYFCSGGGQPCGLEGSKRLDEEEKARLQDGNRALKIEVVLPLLQRFAVLGDVETFELALAGHPQGHESADQLEQHERHRARPEQGDRNAVELQQ